MFCRASVYWVARASSTAPSGELHKRASGSSIKGGSFNSFQIYIYIPSFLQISLVETTYILVKTYYQKMVLKIKSKFNEFLNILLA